jgi:hypothetical protein
MTGTQPTVPADVLRAKLGDPDEGVIDPWVTEWMAENPEESHHSRI